MATDLKGMLWRARQQKTVSRGDRLDSYLALTAYSLQGVCFGIHCCLMQARKNNATFLASTEKRHRYALRLQAVQTVVQKMTNSLRLSPHTSSVAAEVSGRAMQPKQSL